MYILGISAFYHDSSASLLCDGTIIAAVQEERFTRKKADSSFPINSINYCLEFAGITIDEIEYIVFYDKPIQKFDRILASYLHTAPHGILSFLKSIPLWLKEKLWTEEIIQKKLGTKKKIYFTEHHISHAASAFFCSKYESCAILTIDGAGEWATTTISIGNKNRITQIKKLNFPHSLGLLYSAFTYYCGFRVNSGEYKLMGLAPYGTPIYKDLILQELIDLKDDGSFALNEKYFDYISGLRMINKKFERLFGMKRAKTDSITTKFSMDIASSIQEVTNIIIQKMAVYARNITGESNLCIAGGVGLNCVANSAILESRVFDDIFIQPASNDAGCSIGATLYMYHSYLGNKRDLDKNTNLVYLGPSFSNSQVKNILDNNSIIYHELSEDELIEKTVEAIIEQKVVGWFQGRMEFGPRALGNRSILADPRSEKMQREVNLKIKFRESFRPFAPSVLKEYTSDFFDFTDESPYMLLTAKIRNDKRFTLNDSKKELGILDQKRSVVSAVTHVDFSARLQTVTVESNKLYYKLIENFYRKTRIPMLINTSFNVRGEPIVCTPLDALYCFFGSNIEVLAISNILIYKNEQTKKMDIKKWEKSRIKD